MFIDRSGHGARAATSPRTAPTATRPRRRLATGAIVATVALAATACGGGSGTSSANDGSTNGGHGSTQAGKAEYGTILYGVLPPAGQPVQGGTISFAQLTGQTPTEILPILSGSNASTANFELNGAMYLSLYSGPRGATPAVDYAESAAKPPVFSDGDRTVTIPLKQGLKWSNGAAVDANDVVFYFDLLKAGITESAANWAQFTPGQFPQGVTRITAPNSHTVVMHLDKPYNPGYLIYDDLQDTGGGVYPLPSTAWNIDRAGGPHLSDWRNPAVAKKIFNYLSHAGTSVATFASDSLWQDVDGPFKLKDFNVTNGSYDLVPNHDYGLAPKPVFSDLAVQTYTSTTAALDALKTGAVDVAPLDQSELGQVGTLHSQGVSVFGAPSFGFDAGIFNFKDQTDDFDHVIAQTYVRQALEHLANEPALITGVYKGAAAPSYGPVSAAPKSPYVPASLTRPAYPYSPAAAVALLKAHGWKVIPGGQTTCAKPGTGSGECGAGIPAGTPIKFTWATVPESISVAAMLEAEALSSIAKSAAGIDITVQGKSLNFMFSNYNDSAPAAAKYTNDWGVVDFGSLLNDYYPTVTGYDSPGALDFGGYDDPTANRLFAASEHSADRSAVVKEATYITHNLPALYLPNSDVLVAVGKGVGGPAASWTSLTEQATFYPQYWYRTQ